MPRMSDFKIDKIRWNVGLIGGGGTGKSTMCSTFPGRIFLADCDDKIAPYVGSDCIYHQFIDKDPSMPRAYKELKMIAQSATQNNGALYV